jgi:hypothetical protein
MFPLRRSLASASAATLIAENVRKMFPTATKELADCAVAAFLPVQVRFFGRHNLII